MATICAVEGRYIRHIQSYALILVLMFLLYQKETDTDYGIAFISR